jgi:hypothetical protein
VVVRLLAALNHLPAETSADSFSMFLRIPKAARAAPDDVHPTPTRLSLFQILFAPRRFAACRTTIVAE